PRKARSSPRVSGPRGFESRPLRTCGTSAVGSSASPGSQPRIWPLSYDRSPQYSDSGAIMPRASPNPWIGPMYVLARDKQVEIIAALTEGCSIRAVERLTGIHRDTIMRLGVNVGIGCAKLHHALMRDVRVNRIELDEIWQYSRQEARPGQRSRPD